jgi:uncharacterized membrane protein (UPF0182 family)
MSSNPQFDFAKSFGRGTGGRRVSPLSITVGILVVAAIALVSLSGFYADWLWYKSVDYTSVWSTTLFTKVYLFFGFGLVTSLFVLLNVYLAF